MYAAAFALALFVVAIAVFAAADGTRKAWGLVPMLLCAVILYLRLRAARRWKQGAVLEAQRQAEEAEEQKKERWRDKWAQQPNAQLI